MSDLDDELFELIARARLAHEPPAHRQLLASAPSWFVPPPPDWRHPVTQRFGWLPDPGLVAFGMYVKRARYLADMTQDELARKSGVDQGMISRLERALSPSTKTERLVKLSEALGRALPLGFCPHEHPCQWQPAPPPPSEEAPDRLSPAMREIAARIARGEAEEDE